VKEVKERGVEVEVKVEVEVEERGSWRGRG
jgi:hypothetical protein